MRRWPLLLTLLPLVAGIAVYWQLWSGWADGFRAAMSPWLPGRSFTVTGFPYRLEAEVAQPRWQSDGRIAISASAASARINRGPWRPELTVVQARRPVLSAALHQVLSAQLSAVAGAGSVHHAEGRLQRLSIVLDQAVGRLGFAGPLSADTLELHLRERMPGKAAAGPTLPPRGQGVIAARGLRLDGGDPLGLDADIDVTGAAPLTSHAGWRAGGGTLEVTALTLIDATGEVARLRATLVPEGEGAFRMAGTVSTVCPLAVAAALTGSPAPPERRLRAPLTLALEGRIGTAPFLRLAGQPADLAARPRRAQLPPCPRLAG